MTAHGDCDGVAVAIMAHELLMSRRKQWRKPSGGPHNLSRRVRKRHERKARSLLFTTLKCLESDRMDPRSSCQQVLQA
jgi:hypothetical protein